LNYPIFDALRLVVSRTNFGGGLCLNLTLLKCMIFARFPMNRTQPNAEDKQETA
jgi:hypothetical protein